MIFTIFINGLMAGLFGADTAEEAIHFAKLALKRTGNYSAIPFEDEHENLSQWEKATTFKPRQISRQSLSALVKRFKLEQGFLLKNNIVTPVIKVSRKTAIFSF